MRRESKSRLISVDNGIVSFCDLCLTYFPFLCSYGVGLSDIFDLRHGVGGPIGQSIYIAGFVYYVDLLLQEIFAWLPHEDIYLLEGRGMHISMDK
jgi:hypothetical protein